MKIFQILLESWNEWKSWKQLKICCTIPPKAKDGQKHVPILKNHLLNFKKSGLCCKMGFLKLKVFATFESLGKVFTVLKKLSHVLRFQKWSEMYSRIHRYLCRYGLKNYSWMLQTLYFPVLKAQQKDSRKYSIMLSYCFTITFLS